MNNGWNELYTDTSTPEFGSGMRIITKPFESEMVTKIKMCQGCHDMFEVDKIKPELAQKKPYGYYCENCLNCLKKL